MLSELRKLIFALTAERKFPVPKNPVRTFFLLASPALFHIKDWCQTWFPILDDDVAHLYPWLLVPEKLDEFPAQVETAKLEAFNARRLGDMTMRGFRPVGAVNQVVVVADLSDPSIVERVNQACQLVRQAFAEVAGPEAQVFWIGIFLLRRIPSADEAQAGRATDPKEVERLGETLTSGRFSRVFLLDNTNPQGTMLAEAREQHCLAGHLLYFLTAYPSLAETSEKYTDWLLSCDAQQQRVTSAAAFSLVLPIDQILELVALARGALVVRFSLLEEHSPERHKYFLKSFQVRSQLADIKTALKSLSELQDTELPSVLRDFPDFFSGSPDSYFAQLTEFQGSFKAIMKESAELVRQLAELRYREWQEMLDEHLEAMMSHEPGGIPMALKFLDALDEHIDGLIQTCDAAEPKIEPPDEHVRKLKSLVESGPRTEAMYGRAAALAAASDAGLAACDLLPPVKLGVLIGAPVVSLGLAAFAMYTYRQQIENEVIAIRQAYLQIERVELDAMQRRILKKLFKDLRALVRSLKREVADARDRVQELVDFFRDDYLPPFAEEFAYWRYVIKERAEMLTFERMCSADIAKVAADYLDSDEPLTPWRRLEPSGAKKPPNNWEELLFVKAALRVLPDCKEIINMRILDFLQSKRAQFGNYKMTMLLGAQPFLRLKPGAERPEREGILEAEQGLNQPIVQEFMDGLAPHYTNVQQLVGPTAFRITFFGFLRGSALTDVEIH